MIKQHSGCLGHLDEKHIRRLIIEMLYQGILRETFVKAGFFGKRGGCGSGLSTYLELGKNVSKLRSGNLPVEVSTGEPAVDPNALEF